MKTRQELILDFMLAMAATEKTVDIATQRDKKRQVTYALEIYFMAAIFADEYLSDE